MPKPVQVERTFQLSKGVGIADIRSLFEAFGDTIFPEPFRQLKEYSQFRDATIRRSFSVTDQEGKFTGDSLPQLADHLGRRRVERFAIKLDAPVARRTLTVRSDGSRVVVRAGSMTRDRAVGLFEPAVMTLALVSPGSGAAGTRPASRRSAQPYMRLRGGIPDLGRGSRVGSVMSTQSRDVRSCPK